MICYFAKRDMTILLNASTGLSSGDAYIYDDKKIESIENGQDTFSCFLGYSDGNRKKAEAAAEVGNYILKKSDKDEFYTIIESECDPISREIYIYAEAAGLDLIGEMCDAFEASSPMSLAQYASKWLYDTGFEIGIDESEGEMALSWEDSETATARILSTAEKFGCEVSYRYEIDRLSIEHKYVDFHARRGNIVLEPLRRGRDYESMRVHKSIENIATALKVTGGTPDGAGIHRDSDSSYTWVKFSAFATGRDEENSASMQDDSEGMQFIGISAGHATDEEGEDPDEYVWGMIRKATGIYAVPSVKGYRESNDIGGRARYTWVMFATDEYGSNMSDQPTDRSYIGLALHKTSETKGTLTSQYTWYPMDYSKGCRDIYINPGTGAVSEGNGLYTWIKFANSADGSNMSDSPSGKSFIGIAFHRTSSIKTTTASDYEWHEISLRTTTGGVALFSPFYPGVRQNDGTYLWYKFAMDGTGKDMSGAPNNRPYLGIAYDQTSCIQSESPADYEWDLIDADESSEVTLKGMDYNDGDFWVDSAGRLRSEVALSKWSRYISPDESGTDVGHIVGEFDSDITNQDDLLNEAIAELKRRREPEITYEIDLIKFPEGLGIGDTVPIVDIEGGLYLTARLLKLTTSEEKKTHTAVFGEYTRISTTLSDQIEKLTAQQREAERYKYTWVVYADSAEGDNIRINSIDASFMGVAYNKATPTPDLTDPFEYTWSLIGAGETGILSVTYYYLLQDESANPPTKPVEDTPAGWSTAEPSYTEGSTDVLYSVIKTTYTDGSFEYGEVSISSSYAAARAAYTQALEAKKSATNYVSADSTGLMVANMADGNTYTPGTVPSGVKNTFIGNESFDIRDGTSSLASFGTTTRIGRQGAAHLEQSASGLKVVGADGDNYVNIGAQSSSTSWAVEEYIVPGTETDEEGMTTNGNAEIGLPIELASGQNMTLTIDSAYTIPVGTAYSYTGENYAIAYDGSYTISITNMSASAITATIRYAITQPTDYGITARTPDATRIKARTVVNNELIAEAGLYSNVAGNAGLFDAKRGKWIVLNDVSGNTKIPGLTPKLLYASKVSAPATKGSWNYMDIQLSQWAVIAIRALVHNVIQFLVFFSTASQLNQQISDRPTQTLYVRGGFMANWSTNRIYVRWLDGTAEHHEVSFDRVYGLIRK